MTRAREMHVDSVRKAVRTLEAYVFLRSEIVVTDSLQTTFLHGDRSWDV